MDKKEPASAEEMAKDIHEDAFKDMPWLIHRLTEWRKGVEYQQRLSCTDAYAVFCQTTGKAWHPGLHKAILFAGQEE